MEFIYKLIQIFYFSATQHAYSQSEFIISHKASESHLETLHIHVPYMEQSPSKGGGSFVGGLWKRVCAPNSRAANRQILVGKVAQQSV